MSMPRIPYVDADELPDSYDVIEAKSQQLPDDIDSDFWNEQPTVLTFSNNPALGKAHVTMNTELWLETGLSAEQVECVILAIARAYDSEYEWHDHVIAAIGRTDLSRESILALSHQEFDALGPVLNPLARYATEFVKSEGNVSDETHEDVAAHFDDDAVAGLAILAGYYVSLVHVLRALDITLEEEFVGWELENY